MRTTRCLFALLLAIAGPVAAQSKDDAFARALFDPQLVLKYAKQIGLTDAQRKSMMAEIKTAQTVLAPLQIDLAEPALELVELADQPRVDEAKALAKVEQVLKVENEVKKRQAMLMFRVKNLLSPEQQKQLRALRDASNDADLLSGRP